MWNSCGLSIPVSVSTVGDPSDFPNPITFCAFNAVLEISTYHFSFQYSFTQLMALLTVSKLLFAKYDGNN
jgi:hypothetical protein